MSRLLLAQVTLAPVATNCAAGIHVVTTAVSNVVGTVTVTVVEVTRKNGGKLLLLLLLLLLLANAPPNGFRAPKKRRCCGRNRLFATRDWI